MLNKDKMEEAAAGNEAVAGGEHDSSLSFSSGSASEDEPEESDEDEGIFAEEMSSPLASTEEDGK